MTEFIMFAAGLLFGIFVKIVGYTAFVLTLCYYLWPIPLSAALGFYFMRKAYKSSLK